MCNSGVSGHTVFFLMHKKCIPKFSDPNTIEMSSVPTGNILTSSPSIRIKSRDISNSSGDVATIRNDATTMSSETERTLHECSCLVEFIKRIKDKG